MNITDIKKAFPIFTHHPDLIYLDSAATALKPAVVIASEQAYYEQCSTNIARGIYPLAEQTTTAFEESRATVARFIGARTPEEVIFTAGTTASLNLTADLLASRITKEDNIVTTALEHHSNFLPWKELAKRNKAELRIVPVTETGTLHLEALKKLVDNHTKIVAFSATSNVLGTINPVSEIIRIIRSLNKETVIIVDAAQAVGHIPVDVVAWDADFIAFSGHKLFGPTGVGVLFGKQTLLNQLSPVAFGGGMVLDACALETLYKDAPARFEAGTPNIAGIIGLGAAITFIESIGVAEIHAHETKLARYACQALQKAFGDDIRILAAKNPEDQSSIVSFTLTGAHPHDTAQLLGEHNICVRAGLQCAAPLHEALNLSATTRLSFSIYNTEHDIDLLITRLKEIRTIL
ncbi:MAG: SufS family cysteine desulfurase [Candidatus Moranbacteria bacterium]|nr:SufS family cysteine desulfurase [Candidatus Moranbacteria bacterium]